jgi:hypothetical protein
MSLFLGAGATSIGVVVGSTVAGVVLAGVAGVAGTTVARNALLGSDAPTKGDVNAARYADE